MKKDIEILLLIQPWPKKEKRTFLNFYFIFFQVDNNRYFNLILIHYVVDWQSRNRFVAIFGKKIYSSFSPNIFQSRQIQIRDQITEARIWIHLLFHSFSLRNLFYYREKQFFAILRLSKQQIWKSLFLVYHSF